MKLKRIVLGMVVITMFISLTGCKQQTDKPFKIKETKITHKIIPYESFQSEAFYEEYLKPLMLEVGFKEEDAYLKASEKKSKYVYYSDNSLVQTDYNSYGRFEIPNSRYVLGFQYKLSNLTAAKDFYSEKKIYPDIGCDAYSYYALFITLNEKPTQMMAMVPMAVPMEKKKFFRTLPLLAAFPAKVHTPVMIPLAIFFHKNIQRMKFTKNCGSILTVRM